jgi:N-acetylglucosamine kinase-like BadF-type ATPase
LVAEAVDQLGRVGAASTDDGNLYAHAGATYYPDVPDKPGLQTTPATPVLLAIDGGSTKTDAVLVSDQGEVLGRARVGPSNHQLMGIDAAVDAIGEAVAEATRAAGIDDPPFPLCPTGVYCLAGLDLAIDEARLTPAIAHRGWTGVDLLRNDTFAISRAGTSATWGLGLVCGTGMNCAATGPDGQSIRFPALAELSGDFAPGGSWLGLRALGLALRANDGRGRPTLLSDRVASHFALSDPETVLTNIYSGEISYHRIFELAQVLLDTANEGDEVAQGAAHYLADEVVAFATAAINRLGVAQLEVEVVLGGGVFDTAYGGFLERVTEGIHRVAPNAVIKRLAAPPVLGAALLGLDAIGASDAAKQRLTAALTN